MKLFLFADLFPLAQHAGFQHFLPYVSQWYPDTEIFYSPQGLIYRAIGKFYSCIQGFPPRNQCHAAAEAWFRLCGHPKPKGILYHIMVFEAHHWLWEKPNPGLVNMVTTIHHPWPRPFSVHALNNLKRVANLIVLSHAGWDWYCDLLGPEHVFFSPYGIDTNFFRPSTQAEQFLNPVKLLFIGQNGRNTLMLYRVFQKLCERYPNIHLDCVVPVQYRDQSGLKELLQNPNVTWYTNLSDEALLNLYWQNYLLLIPFQESSANSAILEAMSSGLPIVTTDVGGIRDYGGGNIFPLVLNNDDTACIDLVSHYIDHPSERELLAKKGRKFVEENFSLPHVSLLFFNILKKLMA